MTNHLTPLLPSERVSPVDTSSQSTGVFCDISEGKAFYPDRNAPPVPVVVAFGAGQIHQYKILGTWDLDRAVNENREMLFRTFRFSQNGASKSWEDVIFRFGKQEFLCVDNSRIVSYAATPEDAERLALEFSAAYAKPPPETAGSFQLIRICSTRGVDCEHVQLGLDTILCEEGMQLHYPQGTDAWHRVFIEKLNGRRHGLSIFEGPPGTGKTSYLRHLMGALKDSHRFYFIPPSSMSLLSKPEFVGFWANQRQRHSAKKLVVILEDADAALMTRNSENREQVSSILNLSDGMLGDFLALYIICTINCTAADIDQALLRPGRLLCHKVFNRLAPSEAIRLAASLGTSLPEGSDYSLAEVFAGEKPQVAQRPLIGFSL